MRRASAADKELIAHARKHGYKVTARQLERWRQEGLIDRTERKGLGRGKGVMSIITPRTYDQVVEVAAYLAQGATYEELR